MEGEDGRGQRGPGNLEPPQDAEQQDGGEAVQKDVDEVIARGGVAPDAVLQPEGRVQQGVILLGGSEVRPDPPEPAQRAQLRPGDVCVVVPQERAERAGR
jgi:hypothetical protein